jgi:hypothetical protein
MCLAYQGQPGWDTSCASQVVSLSSQPSLCLYYGIYVCAEQWRFGCCGEMLPLSAFRSGQTAVKPHERACPFYSGDCLWSFLHVRSQGLYYLVVCSFGRPLTSWHSTRAINSSPARSSLCSEIWWLKVPLNGFGRTQAFTALRSWLGALVSTPIQYTYSHLGALLL